MSDQQSQSFNSLLQEKRVFPPSPEFRLQAYVKSLAEYKALHQRSLDENTDFWNEMAYTLDWDEEWHTVLDWQEPFAKWFVGGKLNVAKNCVDRHLSTWRKNKAAIIWEGEPGDSRILTYQTLHREVCRFANALLDLGVKAGDRVAIYMGMVPELAIAMLACARIGATHSIIFGGFRAEAIRDRVIDAGASLIITCDGAFRRGQVVPLKENVDKALEDESVTSVRHVVVVKRTHNEVTMQLNRDHWWEDLVSGQSADHLAESFDSEHPLFILYTSGTTGKPKGVVHSSAGYLLGTTLTSRWVFDLKDDDTYWCTADIGWITGHSYIIYGLLSNGATTVMYEGAPNFPHQDRFWSLIDKYQVTIFYTAPTAIRTFVKWGEEWVKRHRLDSLRLLGTVGEPINPEAWTWYHRVVGQERCPVVDTWWQTETGAIMIAPLPGAVDLKPGSATLPFFGIEPAIVDKSGKPVPQGQGGYLTIRRPWPSMMRGIWGDPERFAKTYWSDFPGSYFTGDGARQDEDGYYWLMGRVDDVLNVSGHRLGTMEIESALVSHPAVAEAAVVPRPDEITGQAVVAFVTLKEGVTPAKELKEALRAHVTEEIGALARPAEVRFAAGLPKTRSGKIMRRLLRDIAAGKETVGDTTTLEDYTVLAALRASDEE